MLRTITTAIAALATLAGSACGGSGETDDDALDDAAAVDDGPVDDVAGSDATVDDAAGSDATVDSAATPTTRPAGATTPPPRLTVDMTWHWQLQGEIDTAVDADVYDIDLFDTPASTIAELRADGRIVLCYFSTAWEDWRDDAAAFPVDALGAPLDDWDGERWVDITDPTVRDLLVARLDLAVAKGCDGVEPDNVTAYRNDTGFELSADDQSEFNRFLADEGRARGLLVGLKNDLEQIPELVDHFDFAVNEQCVEYDECDVYEPFRSAGKVVFGAEYSDEAIEDPQTACAVAAAAGIRMVVLPLELDGSFRIPCP